MVRVVMLEDYMGSAHKLECMRKLGSRVDLRVHISRSQSEDEIIDRLKDADILITIRDRILFPRPLLRRLQHVKLISVCGARLSHIDLEAAKEYGIRIIAPSLEGQGTLVKETTAEQTWNLVLALVKQTTMNQEVMQRGGWQTAAPRALAGRTIGLIGLGMVGGQVAEIAKAMRMRVLAWSPHLTTERAQRVGAECVAFTQIFSDSDIVSVHAPLLQANRGMIGESEIGLMRPDALLINTARAALVDEGALRASLSSGAIGGVGLDVYWEEPLPPTHWLRREKNAVLQPHLGGFTEEGFRQLVEPAVENVIAFLDATH